MGAHGRQAGSARYLLMRDHERLDALLGKLLETFLDGDPGDVRAMWTRFDAALSAHLEAEERQLLPLFARTHPAEAAGLLAEHAQLRRSLDDLGVSVDLHAVSLEAARAFVGELRAHARREDALLYRWSDGIVGDAGGEGRLGLPGPASGARASLGG